MILCYRKTIYAIINTL